MTIYALKDGALARFFAVLAIFTMIVSLLPMQAFAQEATSTDPDQIEQLKINAPEETELLNARSLPNPFDNDFEDYEEWTCSVLTEKIEWIEEEIEGATKLEAFFLKIWLKILENWYEDNCDEEEENEKKIDICHVNEGEDGYNFINVSINTITNPAGHENHDEGGPLGIGDIIPPFEGFDGLNWEEPYIALYENECVSENEPTTGTLVITKYECPVDTAVVRSENGVGGVVPEACELQEGADFGYVHGIQTDANAPHPELSEAVTEAGDTDANGVLEVELEATGRYLVVETDGEGNKIPHGDILDLYCEGDGSTDDTEHDNQEITFIEAGEESNCVAYNKMTDEPADPVATIVATKLVCTDETDLPNWGLGEQVNIDADTATDWLAEHDSCSLQPGWEFEWAQHDIADPRDGDDTDPSGAGWNAFDSVTDANGVAEVELTAAEINGGAHVWVREELKDGYIPFTWFGAQDNSNDVSAEIYCSTDVLNYDNWERIDGIAVDEEYYCVAWNVPIDEPVDPVCEIGENLIENGSFEDPEVLNDTWEVYPSGTSSLDWIVSWMGSFLGAPDVANLELQENVEGWNAEEGDQYAELDTDWDANVSGEQASVKIAQDVATEAGATYELRYSFSARPNTGLSDNDLDVLIESVVADSHSADGTALSNTSWTTYAKEFVASDASTEIAFADAGTANSVGTLLDNVVVCKVKDAPMCVDELQGSWADDVVSEDQGLRKNGTAVLAARSDSQDALGVSDWNTGDTDGFYSLGFGGEIALSFDSYVPNVAGVDLKVHEATNGTYPAETADVFVSQDGSTWLLAGVANNSGVTKITDIDFDATGLTWIKFIKIVDTSNQTLYGAYPDADGFDLDAVEVMQQVCEQPEDPEMCTLTIVSNEDDQVGANDAVLVTFFHEAWDAVVTGASWIWSDNPVVDPVGETNKTFTKSFTWSGDEADIVSATLTIAADNSYDAEINSTSAASSTVENNFGASTVHDVTDLIETGSNTIEVDVKNWALSGGTIETNPAGLLYKLEIVGENANCEEDNESDDDPTPDETVSSELIVVKAEDLETETDRFIADANDSGKWFFYNDETDAIDNNLGSFVNGPATAPLGDGSAQSSVSGTQRRNLATYQFDGVKLADIKTLKFSTYNPSAGNGGSANRSGYLNFNVSFDGNDTWQKRLVYVPSENGTVLQDTWQEWDAIDGGNAQWSYSGATWPTTSEAEVGVAGTVEKTWNEILVDYPMIETRESDSFMGIRVGEPYADGYTENLDKFVIGIKTGLNTHTKTFNFEPTEPTVSSELIVVSPEDMKGWAFVQETASGSGSMVSGPAVPVIGTGSAELVVDSAGGELLGSAFANTFFSNITTLQYSTYRTAGDPALAASLQLNVDADSTDGTTGWQGRLVYEPYYTQTVNTGVWQTWDTQDDSAGTGTGNWWFSNGTLATNTGCTQANPCTWSEVKTALPNGSIHQTLGGVGFKAGSNWSSGFTGNVDKFVIGVKTGSNTHTTTYDFEPEVPTGEFTLSIFTTGEGDGMITGDGIECDSNTESDCSQSYPFGTEVVLTVIPDEGSNFDNSWSVGAGSCTGNATPCTVAMTSDVDLTAHFDLDEDGDNDDDSSSTNRSGGGRISLTDENDDDEDFGFGGDDADLPEGRVLGEQASAYPLGAPNTGAGGAASQSHSTESLLALISALLAAVFARKMQKN
jgi:hypothetical protein